jgi:hypothetical protein
VSGRALAVTSVVALLLAGSGAAGWGSGGTGSGSAGAKSMPGGNTPSATALLTSVSLTWSASSFAAGPDVAGYVVKRYSALGGGAQTPGGTCVGTVGGTGCSDSGVAPGTYTYTVTPVQGSWTGAESGQSNSVVKL